MNRNIKLILSIFTLLAAVSMSGCIDQTEENAIQDETIDVAVSILPQQEFV
ncbi:MAG: zinc ABC transporter substrate-binding protein, partial [Methanosarcinales archaeon]|nr:zinc ABC transporter substrate-binding protein [Methanosarcinales archaeon]